MLVLSVVMLYLFVLFSYISLVFYRYDSNLSSRAVFLLHLESGTVLKAAQYFDDSAPIPPTLAFGLGSLGFLAPFDPDQSQSMISRCGTMR